MALTCRLDGCGGATYPGHSERDWKRHILAFHEPHIKQIATVDWHARALAVTRNLAATGERFTFYDVAKIAGDPINPQSMWGTFAKEVRHLKIAEPVDYQESERPESGKSAVKVWQRPVAA